LTQALFIETAKAEEAMQLEGTRRLNVSRVLSVLGVSRNGYYSFKKRKPSNSQLKKETRMERIQEIHEDSHQNYGAPKITECLLGEGEIISEKTVGNYMREMGIKAQYIKPYVQTTVDSNFSEELHNILDEQFNPEQPNAVWCSDITYIWTFEGFVYLTSIMDLFSRKIIAWVLSDTLEAKWVVETIEKAKKKRHVDQPLVMHSDRGVQYTCSAYQEATEGFINSYSKKAYPWDNACIESFHALLKREWINRFKIFDYHHAYKLVFEYIETFYNTVRIHSHCGYLSPNAYEQQYREKMDEMIRKVS
jgi:transposase InsO family protein